MNKDVRELLGDLPKNKQEIITNVFESNTDKIRIKAICRIAEEYINGYINIGHCLGLLALLDTDATQIANLPEFYFSEYLMGTGGVNGKYLDVYRYRKMK